MGKKSIAIVIKCLLGNGAEKVVQQQSSLFHKYGHDVHIFCFTDIQEIPINENVPIHIFPVNRFKWLPKSLRKHLTASRLDLFIISKMGTPDLVLSNLNAADRILCLSKLKVALLHHMHLSTFYLKGLNPEDLTKKLEKFDTTYGQRKSIAVSKGVCDDIRKYFPKWDIQTIYNPLDLDYVKSNAQQHVDDTPSQYLLHVGSFTKVKRHDILLQAYALSEQTLPLLLIGKGPLEPEIRSLISQLGLEKKVTLLGFKTNPYPYISRAHGLIVSSQSEALPTVILEAIALNTPVISTDCPCGPAEILPAPNLIPVASPKAMAILMNELSSNPQNFLSEAPTEFAEQHIVEKYLNIFENTIPS